MRPISNSIKVLVMNLDNDTTKKIEAVDNSWGRYIQVCRYEDR